eukprot:7611-Prymnesium_polylepis.1
MLIVFLSLLSASTTCADLPASSTRLGRVTMPRVLPGARGLRPPALFYDLRERRASRTASGRPTCEPAPYQAPNPRARA